MLSQKVVNEYKSECLEALLPGKDFNESVGHSVYSRLKNFQSMIVL